MSSLNDRILKQRQKLAAAKRRLREGSASSRTPASKFKHEWPDSKSPRDLETKQKTTTKYFTGRNNTTSSMTPQPSPFGATVRAAGPLRTPEVRHSDFRRMSSFPSPPSGLYGSSESSVKRDSVTTSPYTKKFGNLATTFNNNNDLNPESSRDLRKARVTFHQMSDPDPKDLHTATALREQLERKKRELLATKDELTFTGNIMDMLRADIAKTDAESASQLAIVQEAKDTKLL